MDLFEFQRNLHGEVKFLIASKGIQKKRQPSTVLHLRALFDYDPEVSMDFEVVDKFAL